VSNNSTASTTSATNSQADTARNGLPPISERFDVDVVIAGGGIAGSALACGLRNSGLRVAVIESRRNPMDTARGDHLQPVVVELLQRWGVLDEFMARGAGKRVGHEFRLPNGEAAIAASYDELDLPVPYFVVVDHDKIDEWFLEIAQRDAAENLRVIKPATVQGITFDDHGVATSVIAQIIDQEGGAERFVEITGSVFVGADGMNSVVRAQSGFAVTETRYRQPMVAMFGSAPAELGRLDYFYRYAGPAGQLVIQPRMGGTIKVTRPIGSEGIPWWRKSSADDRAQRLGVVAEVLGGFDGEVSGFYPARRIEVTSFARGNVVLVGDAAHAMHPARGQGLNMGIASLGELIDCLPSPSEIASVEGANAVVAGLATYNDRVKPQYDQILAKNHEAAGAMEASADGFPEGAWEGETGFLRMMAGDPALRRAHLLEATGYPFGVPSR
jgi:2-polyprenyl-6-methoxyphenol hydroxylase-like FAD-dependent oxidoreductase